MTAAADRRRNGVRGVASVTRSMLGVDVGGTFTDFVVYDPASRQVTVSSTSPGAGVTVPDPGLVVPQADLASAVVSFDAEAHVLVLDDLPGVLSLVEPGSTIAVDPIAPHLPDGLFHEVVRVQAVPGGWSVQLAPASMFEAFRQIDVTQAPAGAGASPSGDAGASSDAPSIGRDFDAAWCDNGEYEPDPGPDPDPGPRA